MKDNINKLIKILVGDKAFHFVYSFMFTVIGICLINMPLGIIPAILFGLGKEVYDSTTTSGWSWGDLLADALGIIFGVLILMI